MYVSLSMRYAQNQLHTFPRNFPVDGGGRYNYKEGGVKEKRGKGRERKGEGQ